MIQTVPQNYFAPLDLVALFGRVAPLEVDLGCGDGNLLCELARENPERNLLGIDKLNSRVAKACRKAAALDNVRVLNVEISYAVRYLLPENSVETFYLLFPDPWPKRRHHRRRIVQPDFLDSIHRALTPAGIFRIATDQADYFKQIEHLSLTEPRFRKIEHDDVDPRPLTKFERRFRSVGAPIYRLALQKTSPVTYARACQSCSPNSSSTAPVSS